MKKNLMICFITVLLTGTSVLCACGTPGNTTATPSPADNTPTSAPTQITTGNQSMTVSKEKIPVSDDTYNAIVQLINNKTFKSGDVLDLSAVSSADSAENIGTFLRLIFQSHAAFDAAAQKLTFETEVTPSVNETEKGITINLEIKY